MRYRASTNKEMLLTKEDCTINVAHVRTTVNMSHDCVVELVATSIVEADRHNNGESAMQYYDGKYISRDGWYKFANAVTGDRILPQIAVLSKHIIHECEIPDLQARLFLFDDTTGYRLATSGSFAAVVAASRLLATDIPAVSFSYIITDTAGRDTDINVHSFSGQKRFKQLLESFVREQI